MRIAYVLTWNLAHNDSVRKIFQQVQEWRKYGHGVEMFAGIVVKMWRVQIFPKILYGTPHWYI